MGMDDCPVLVVVVKKKRACIRSLKLVSCFVF